ncbi:MAG: 2-phospho-L-lactate guanylyltransferase [Acidimicrobiia bacterium]|nr:2-phospho-L-lactate guanylyltransferase [Acidimicrobiia bacterium]
MIPTPAGGTGVVLPVRSFAHGKARLAGRLEASTRRELSERMAERVRVAAEGRPVVVVTDDPEVAAWARDRGAGLIADPGDLDGAARAGLSWCRGRGLTRGVVAHADLPLARSLSAVDHDGRCPVAVLVPCHRDDGTTVVSVPIGADFGFSYGPGSFRRHCAAARRAGLAVRVVRDASLAFDVDVDADLDRLLRVATPA